MDEANRLPVFSKFDHFAREFLDPLAKRKMRRTKVPLSAMPGWKVNMRFDFPYSKIDELANAAGRLDFLMGWKGHPETSRQEAFQTLTRLVLEHVTVESIEGRYTIDGWHCELENGPECDHLPHNWYHPGASSHPGSLHRSSTSMDTPSFEACGSPATLPAGGTTQLFSSTCRRSTRLATRSSGHPRG
jgi:hypothetical protein